MTIRSKTIAVIAATLALSSVGSAFAQDRNHGPDRDGRDGRYEQHDQRPDGRQDNWRGNDHRNDYRGDYRGDYRNDYRDGRHYDRRGFSQPHAEWHRGGRVPNEYRGRGYVVNDYRAYHLNAPPRGYQWVGVGSEFALAAIATGLIAQIVIGQ
ncbi:RcnB family protein [Variovorax sp. J22R133]|uniref:RcnB family protein n=1 Tax=Variovorax brevis TaxID=3053503 RepID=UPI00257770F0|nr:RcnB family protein [Variovorax sp. J22R133]MDM0114764.1 RcnB family protein [Variovorax sp. J22R133]